jgi:peptide/nickel transport system substrate-binding protein
MLERLRKLLPKRWQHSRVWEVPSKQSQQQLAFDQQLVWQKSKRRRVPSLGQLKYVSSFFSARERVVVLLAVFAIFFSGALAAFFVYLRFVEPIPAAGGIYREGLVGTPSYLNPVLAATNDIDLDITHLLFSGLLRYDEELNLQPDLAESWSISEDQKTYTFTLRQNALWHDGEPVTVEDVLFTIDLIQDPSVNSPLQLSFQNVTATATDERTVQMVLSEPFAPFASVLTTGILPEHIWSEIPAGTVRLAELNLKPVGNGPWKFDRLEKDKQGHLYSYTIVPFQTSTRPAPYIDSVMFRFFPDFDTAIEALNNKKVDGLSYIPRQLIDNVTNAQSFTTHHLQVPQYTALFFNSQNNAALKEKTVRQAIAYSFERSRLVQVAFDGLAEIVNGPLLPGMTGYDPELEGYPYNPVEAQRLLEEAGWKAVTAEEYIQAERERIQKELNAAAEESEDEDLPAEESEEIAVDTGNQVVFRKKGNEYLTLRLTAVNQPENVRAAELLKNALQTIGFKVEINIVSVSSLTNTVLPDREYEALLYGQILNGVVDLYPFWHSSQLSHPGLNLAGLSDKDADTLLQTARETSDESVRAESYKNFQKILDRETTAIFLYSPKYTYLLPSRIQGFQVERIGIPADRFNNLEDWYIKTKKEFRLSR